MRIRASIVLFGIFLTALNFHVMAQGPAFEWAVRTGAAGASSIGESVAVDAAGNVYTSGRFTGTVDFDPGAGSVNLTSAGSADAFITKMDPSGNLIWAKRVGGTQDELIYANAIDGSGNVYLTGSFQGTADFDPGPGVFNLTAPGGFIDDIFILKLDPDGNFLWAKRIGASGLDFGQSIAVGPSGVVTTGSFEGTVDFDPGAGTAFLAAPAGQDEIFILKLDANGNFVWTKRMGGSNGDFGRSITLDASENVYSTGFFRGTADFDPGPATFNLTDAGNSDIFVSKLDASGNFVWAKRMGGTDSEGGYGIKVDIAGNVYTTGDFHSTADFDPGIGINNLVSAGFNDSFISKLDASGNFIWAKRIGGDSDDAGTSLSLDGAGNVYSAGSFESSTIDLDPGTGTFNATPVGSGDVFITKLDPSGDFVWAVAFGGPSFDLLNSIHVNAAGRIYTTGYFSNTVDFDPGAGVSNLTAVGIRDIFISKLSQAPVPTIVSFTPTSGPVGTSVTITGTNFSTTPGNNIVYFGATRASVTAATTNQLTVNVPAGTAHDRISVMVNGLAAFSRDPFIVNFECGQSLTVTSFAPKVDLVAGLEPYALARADFDQDGKVDLVSANYSASTASVFLNTSSGPGNISYAAKADFTTGLGRPYAIATGDFDGNGKLDFVLANEFTNTISVFRNTSSGPGNIGFAAIVDFGTGPFPHGIAVSDYNNDGKVDLAVTSNNLDVVSILTNTSVGPGNISFAARIDFATGSAPQDVSDADLDGDGKPDIVVTNYSDNTISVLRNTSVSGTISFAPKTDIATGDTPNFVSVGDLDGDGKLDLAVANAVSETVSLYRNTSVPGNISFAAKLDAPAAGAFAVALGDLTGDGKIDLAVPDFGSSVSVLQNISTGAGNISFSSSLSFTAGSTAQFVTIGDFDQDGKPDLAIANQSSSTISVLRNMGGTVPPAITGFAPANGPVGTSVTISGTNFDPLPLNNIVYFGATKATVTASTSTQLTVTVPYGATYQPISVLAGCLMAFSKDPFVVTFAGGGSFDNCSFEPKVNFETNDGLSSEAFFGDIDGDGKVDVITTKRNANSISIYRNTSTTGQITSSSFAPKIDIITGTSGSANPGPVAISFGDVDGDGKPDIAVVNYRGGTLAVFRNLSTSGVISLSSRVDFAIGDFGTGGSLRDIDGDGKLDAVVTSFFDGVSVLRNTATSGIINASSFASRLNFATGPNPFHPSTADFDNDGKLDIAVPNADNYTVSLLHNTSTSGTVSFAPQQVITYAGGIPALGTGTFPLSAGDLDADGKIDLVVCNNTLSIAPIFRNTSIPGTITFAPQVDLTTTAPPAFASISDLDGDGKVDLALFNGLNNPILVYKNSNVPGPISTSSFGPPIGFGADPLVGVFGIADIDGDGKNDIVNAANGFYVLRNVIGEISPPTLTSFSPAFGDIGTVVTVTGSGFATPFANAVTFDGISAIISGSTATTLTVTVPAGTTTGVIQITIGCNTVSSGTNFALCSVPTPPLATGSSICGSGGLTLIASGGINGNYVWYNVPTGGTSFAGAVNDSFVTPTISVTTNFYVALRSGSCESSRTLVTATIIPLPASPAITAGTGCAPSSIITLGASGGSAGQYRWYITPSGGSPLAGETNPTYTTPSLSTTTTYYVSIDNGTCESLRIAVVAEIRSCTPTISTASVTTPIGSTTTIDIAPLVTTVNDLIDIASIKVIQQPISGALATISAGVLSVDYTRISFAGTDELTIEACDLAGRCAQADITIEVVGDITVYNALSPNGDGKNDNFIIEYIESLPDTQKNKLTIFNRWGDVVFNVDDYDNQSRVFRGLNNNGSELPTGTYYYKLEFPDGGSSRTGFLSLRR